MTINCPAKDRPDDSGLPAAAPGAQQGSPDVSGDGTRKVRIEDLLGSSDVLVILHRGEEYRLRITSNGKLLLTK